MHSQQKEDATQQGESHTRTAQGKQEVEREDSRTVSEHTTSQNSQASDGEDDHFVDSSDSLFPGVELEEGVAALDSHLRSLQHSMDRLVQRTAVMELKLQQANIQQPGHPPQASMSTISTSKLQQLLHRVQLLERVVAGRLWHPAARAPWWFLVFLVVWPLIALRLYRWGRSLLLHK